jgi:hypothetical protein
MKTRAEIETGFQAQFTSYFKDAPHEIEAMSDFSSWNWGWAAAQERDRRRMEFIQSLPTDDLIAISRKWIQVEMVARRVLKELQNAKTRAG